MNTRRNFLATLAGLPFLGFLKPVDAVPVKYTMEYAEPLLPDYDPSTHTITLRRNEPALVEPREAQWIYCDTDGYYMVSGDGERIPVVARYEPSGGEVVYALSPSLTAERG